MPALAYRRSNGDDLLLEVSEQSKYSKGNEKLAHYTTRGSIQHTQLGELTPTGLPSRHLHLLLFIWQNLLYKATSKYTETE